MADKKGDIMKILLLTLALLITGPAWAEWLLIAVSINHLSKMYVDPTTIRKEGDLYKVWTWQELSGPDQIDGSLSVRSLMQYDCKEERSTYLSLTSFSERMLRGKVITNHPALVTKWGYIAPGTLEEGVFRSVCAK